MTKITRATIAEHLLDYQLEMIGKTRLVMIDDDKWKFHNTMTREQLKEFRKYAIPVLQKTFHFNKGKAEETFEAFRTLFGLRIKD